jgi:hypothetical protein
VPVKGFIAIAMVDDHMVTITICEVTRYLHHSVCGCIDRGTLGCRKIEAGMQLNCFINGINAVAKTGCNPVQVFIRHRLNGRCGSQELFFIV